MIVGTSHYCTMICEVDKCAASYNYNRMLIGSLPFGIVAQGIYGSVVWAGIQGNSRLYVTALQKCKFSV